MAAFQAGFQLGQNAYTLAERARQQDELLAIQKADQALRQSADARAAAEHGWRADEQMDIQRRRGLVDTELEGIRNPNFRNFQITPDPAAAAPTGLRAPAVGVDEIALAGGQAAGGLRIPGAGAAVDPGAALASPAKAGLRQPVLAEPAGGYTNRADLTAREREQALGRVAAINRDVAGIRTAAQGEEAFHKREIDSQVMKAPPAALATAAAKFNANDSDFPMIFTEMRKSKNGYEFEYAKLGKDGVPAGKVTLNEAQQRQLLRAYEYGNAGYGTEALQFLDNVHKDFATMVKERNAQTMAVQGKNNDATFKSGSLDADFMKAEAAKTAANAAAARANAERTALANQILNPQVGWIRGPDNQPVQAIVGLRLNRATGAYDQVQVPLDQGFVPQGAVDPTKMKDAVASMVGKPIPGAPQVNGKTPVYDEESAMRALQEGAIRGGLGLPGARPPGAPDVKSDAAKARAFLAQQGTGEPSLASRVGRALFPPVSAQGSW